MRKTLLPIIAATALGSTTAVRAQDLSYHGWAGSVDYRNGSFEGCHLDSPGTGFDANQPLRVVASNGYIDFIQFAASRTAVPSSYTNVNIGLAQDDNPLHDPSWSGHGYRALALRTGSTTAGEPVTRYLLGIPSDDAVLTHMPAAHFMRVYWPNTNTPLFAESLNYTDINLQHYSLGSPHSWINLAQNNDTSGAITVIHSCAVDHTSQPSPEQQTQFDLRYAIEYIVSDLHAPTYEIEMLMRIANFYCQAKAGSPYDPNKGYIGNVNDMIQHASAELGNPEIAARLAVPQAQSTDEIGVRDSSMSAAERLVCPGWPGHFRPEE